MHVVPYFLLPESVALGEGIPDGRATTTAPDPGEKGKINDDRELLFILLFPLLNEERTLSLTEAASASEAAPARSIVRPAGSSCDDGRPLSARVCGSVVAVNFIAPISKIGRARPGGLARAWNVSASGSAIARLRKPSAGHQMASLGMRPLVGCPLVN